MSKALLPKVSFFRKYFHLWQVFPDQSMNVAEASCTIIGLFIIHKPCDPETDWRPVQGVPASRPLLDGIYDPDEDKWKRMDLT